MVYLLNTPVLTSYGDFRFSGPITIEDARDRIGKDFISAIGHEASASLLSRLLGVEVKMNRVAVAMQLGDTALVLRAKERLPEGKVLNETEIAGLSYEFSWLERFS